MLGALFRALFAGADPAAAAAHELAALVSDGGAGRQPVHPDTAHGTGGGADGGAPLYTAFVALQDVTLEVPLFTRSFSLSPVAGTPFAWA